MSLKLLFNNVKAEPDKFFWVGYVPFDESGEHGYVENQLVFNEDLTELLSFDISLLELCLREQTVAKFDEENFPDAIDIELFGEGEYFFAIVPEGYDLLIDTGFGNAVRIANTGEFGRADAMPIGLIDGVQYYLYGIFQAIPGNRTFYLYPIS